MIPYMIPFIFPFVLALSLICFGLAGAVLWRGVPVQGSAFYFWMAAGFGGNAVMMLLTWMLLTWLERY